MFGSLAFFIYCFIIGKLVDEDAFQIAYSSLSIFIVMFLSFLIVYLLNIFKFVPGKKGTVFTFEYEFKDECVIVKNLYSNKFFILNKKSIKRHYVMDDVLVVIESAAFFFLNDEEIKKELGLLNK